MSGNPSLYDVIEFEPEGADLKMLHLRGHGVAHSRIEQFNFLSDFLGGPKLYAEIHGHSNVREMHMHIEIERNAHDAAELHVHRHRPSRLE